MMAGGAGDGGEGNGGHADERRLSDEEWERSQDLRKGGDASAGGPAGGGFIVDIDGFEGPLDLMLELARAHKLDLTSISILYLAEQYLEYIERARNLRMDIAADYLVMAAWLAFLKSKLLLPGEEEEEDEPGGEELAALLAFRLKRLDAMRAAGKRLLAGPQLHVDFFPRGAPEGVRTVRRSLYEADIYDLLSAYASSRLRKVASVVRPGRERRKVWSLRQARETLERILGMDCKWASLDALLVSFAPDPAQRRTALASGFGASLEMAREGEVELRQSGAFAPLYLRRRESGGKSGSEDGSGRKGRKGNPKRERAPGEADAGGEEGDLES
jgi:segregation and condensation protein A